MKHLALVLTLFLFTPPSLSAQVDSAKIAMAYSEIASRIIAATMKDSVAFERLAELCDTFGPRFSGSENLERAIDWCLAKMKTDGFDAVRTEPVMVPRWVRGKESCQLLSPRVHNIAVLGLGGSVSTPKQGITAEVLVVKDFDELEMRASDAKGKNCTLQYPFYTVWSNCACACARSATCRTSWRCSQFNSFGWTVFTLFAAYGRYGLC